MDNKTELPSPLQPDAGSTQEDLTSLNLSDRNIAGMSGVADDCRRRSQSGAAWFFWVAGLSIVNSIVVLANGQWSFLAGLGVTQVISALAASVANEFGGAVTVIAFALDLIVATIFVGFGLFAQKHTWVFVLGMIVYALDGLIFLFVQDWLAIAFHAFVLFSMYRGLAASRELKRLQAEGLAPE